MGVYIVDMFLCSPCGFKACRYYPDYEVRVQLPYKVFYRKKGGMSSGWETDQGKESNHPLL